MPPANRAERTLCVKDRCVGTFVGGPVELARRQVSGAGVALWWVRE